MPNNPTKILLMLTMMSGILISISSNSWIGAWMGMEINLMSFIPLMSNNKNTYTTESSLKYFIIQAMASSFLLFIIMMKVVMEDMFTMENNNINTMIIMTPLLLKSGAAPFHWWFPSVMEGMSWMNCLLLMTMQKLTPMVLISYMMKMNLFSSVIILTSTIVGAIGGLNQLSIRKILTYSSINHTGWMLAALMINENMWIMYFTIYSMLTTTIVVIIKPFNTSFINQTLLMNKDMNMMKFMMFTTLLSMGGLPPFLGFLPKWIVIQMMIINNMNFIMTMMVMMSLLTLYFYLRISYSSFMMLHIEPKWNIKYYKNNNFMMYSSMMFSMSMMNLMICTMMINIY
uniref:NADH-ubiquinone oxidoreductase chain 2 n=1 Tax=Cryptocercus weixiensis TaxID=1980974 RepID=A0A8K1KUC0_9NEOP|nr:NADH dehydrogenase subunit 2 [Hemipenthes hebeiensis]YP_010227826.1 NADH dehydrogenase subunit 2 [Cryptocercus weixiensis]QVJ97668.1 NADH dehydrogenase subunit 2 [Hemipenthes hebeiensis]UDD86612.1 NADH dehydrogenase subunit 2 [Cryptocercus weixiensis]